MFFIQWTAGFIAAFWIGWGGIHGRIDMFRTLATFKHNDAGDGQVPNHYTVGVKNLSLTG